MKTNLQALRKAAGFRSAVDFADFAGINRGTYTNYEQGKRDLTLERAWFFADLLHVTLDELAGRDFHPNTHYSDPLQAVINERFEQLNTRGRMRAVDSLEDIAANAANLKDGEATAHAPSGRAG